MAKSKYSSPSIPKFILGFLSGTILVAALFLAVYMVTSKNSLKSNVEADDPCAGYTQDKAISTQLGTVLSKDVNSFSWTPNSIDIPKTIMVCANTLFTKQFGGQPFTYGEMKVGDKVNITGYIAAESQGLIILASGVRDATKGIKYPQTINDNFSGLVIDPKKWEVVNKFPTGAFVTQAGGTLNVQVKKTAPEAFLSGIFSTKRVVGGNDFDSSVDVKKFTAVTSADHPTVTAELKFYGDDRNFYIARWVRDTAGSYVDFYGVNNGQWFDTINDHLVPEGSTVRLHLKRTGNTITAYTTIGTSAEGILGTQTITYTGSLQPQLLSWKPSPRGTATVSTSFDNFSVSGALQ